MEIADVFVVNKADRPGAAETQSDLTGMLELSGRRAWRPPIVRTVATTGEGVEELFAAITAHKVHLEDDRRRRHAAPRSTREELRGLVAAGDVGACRGRVQRSGVREDRRRGRGPHPRSLHRRGGVAARREHAPVAWGARRRGRGKVPPADGLVEVVPSPGGLTDVIVGLTGHFMLAADVEPAEVAERFPAGEFSAPMSSATLTWLADRLGSRACDVRRAALFGRTRCRRSRMVARDRRPRSSTCRACLPLPHRHARLRHGA